MPPRNYGLALQALFYVEEIHLERTGPTLDGARPAA